MFRWTIARAEEHPALGRGEAPPGFLSPEEQARLARMAFPARRRKWLLGRWAVKRVVREQLADAGIAPPADPAITIANRPSGAPYATVGGEPIPWTISISHREDLAFAALAQEEGAPIGADLETAIERDPALVSTFFTDREAAAAAPGRRGRTDVARTWSAKEAVLKAMGLGLRLDTRSVEILGEVPRRPDTPVGWRPLAVHLHDGGETAAQRPPLPQHDALDVLWRDEGAYVLTVAFAPPA